jgi:pantoate--beta-alanine ligase
MQVLTTISAISEARVQWEPEAELGLVPTMGYLHAGHLSLVRQARVENRTVVASIFVNPKQFGPHEDLARYPRDLLRDLDQLEAAGVDAVFAPEADDMYPAGYATYVEPTGPLADRLEGAARPGHFRGVATVVLKLFRIVAPHTAYFGQKDAQQVAVIQRMVADLNLGVALRILPTIRELDGLAMSSRNAYLGPEGRAAATVLYRALLAGREAFDNRAQGGPDEVAVVERAMASVVAQEPRATLEYADVSDPASFEPLRALRAPAVLAIAARVGPARLIDNFLLRRDGAWDLGVQVG